MPDDKILVIGPSWVGDMVLAQSLFKFIKLRRPGARIDVAAPAWTLPLLERMPEVNEAIALPFKHGQFALRERLRYGGQLRKQGYTQAILLTNSFKSAIVPFVAGIPRRTGFLGEARYGLVNDVRSLDKKSLPRTVDRFVSLGQEPGEPLPERVPLPALRAGKADMQSMLSRLGMVPHEGAILVLCPGAEYGAAKRWPEKYYAEVANAMLSQGWQVWLFGSEKDSPVISSINRLTDQRCLDLGGKTSLGEAIDLMALASVVVSNDSGLMHVAAALDKPTVAIFGSSDPRHTPPMNDTARILSLNLSCSPCFKRECPLGHLNCLRQLKPEWVLNTIKELEHQ